MRGIDLSVREGEIVGFLGPNGAGKTTTLKMLCTLLAPTDRLGDVVGADLRRNPVEVRGASVMSARRARPRPEAKVGEEIVSHARLYGIDKQVAIQRGEEAARGARPRRDLGPHLRLVVGRAAAAAIS